MTLFVQKYGSGSDLVLVHGWGLHGGIWDEQLRTILIQAGYCLHIVDLPGHGNSPAPYLANIDAWAQAVIEVVPPGAIWLGWSLGGMVALAAATFSNAKVRALIMVCTAPRFVGSPDWRAGMNPAVLAIFGAELQENWRTSVMRFLTLQDRGANTDIIRQLRTTLFARPPTPAGLNMGLKILQNSDLRPRLSQITCPALIILGTRDNFFPAALRTDLINLRSDWQISTITGAGHIPFLTHRTEFISELTAFLSSNK